MTWIYLLDGVACLGVWALYGASWLLMGALLFGGMGVLNLFSRQSSKRR